MDKLLALIEKSEVECVVDVYDRRKPESTDHIVLLNGGSHLCTCLLMQNSGIVCRHFFRIMQDDRRFRYHVSLINKRWLQERHQDDSKFDISSQPFLHPNTSARKPDHRANNTGLPVDFLRVLQTLFPSNPPARPNQEVVAQKHMYGELMGRIKKVSSDRTMCKRVLDAVDVVLADAEGIEGLKDPKRVKIKGRPRKSRIKSAMDEKKEKKEKKPKS